MPLLSRYRAAALFANCSIQDLWRDVKDGTIDETMIDKFAICHLAVQDAHEAMLKTPVSNSNQETTRITKVFRESKE